MFTYSLIRKAIYSELQEVSGDLNSQCWCEEARKMLRWLQSLYLCLQEQGLSENVPQQVQQSRSCYSEGNHVYVFVTNQVKIKFQAEEILKKTTTTKPSLFSYYNSNFSSQDTRETLSPSVQSSRQGPGVQWGSVPGISFLAAGNSRCLGPVGGCNLQWWDW